MDIGFFEGRFMKASDAEQELLYEIAKISNEEFSPTDILKNVKMDRQLLNKFLGSMISKEILFRLKRGKYKF